MSVLLTVLVALVAWHRTRAGAASASRSRSPTTCQPQGTGAGAPPLPWRVVSARRAWGEHFGEGLVKSSCCILSRQPPSTTSASGVAPANLLAASSSVPAHDVINWPSPAKTMASRAADGRYAVTCPAVVFKPLGDEPACRRRLGVGS
jgi:hypothetical protein